MNESFIYSCLFILNHFIYIYIYYIIWYIIKYLSILSVGNYKENKKSLHNVIRRIVMKVYVCYNVNKLYNNISNRLLC